MRNEQFDWVDVTKHDPSFRYLPTSEEILFLQAVADGNMSLVQENIRKSLLSSGMGMGVLSLKPLNNMKYHFVITAALVSRRCISAGMPLEHAFQLSDYYIQKADACQTVAEVVHLHTQMVTDYARRMQLLHYPSASKQITKSIDYIYNHISERLTVEILAEAVGISPTYFSRVFKKEIGTSVSDFIRKLKIEYAKNLLLYSSADMADIAFQLSFSSQSHFIQQFRQQTGMTPKVFRDSHRQNEWLLGEIPSAE